MRCDVCGQEKYIVTLGLTNKDTWFLWRVFGFGSKDVKICPDCWNKFREE